MDLPRHETHLSPWYRDRPQAGVPETHLGLFEIGEITPDAEDEYRDRTREDYNQRDEEDGSNHRVDGANAGTTVNENR